MSSQKFFYQTIQINNRALIPTAGVSARGQATGAAVKLLYKASRALNEWAVSYRVNSELNKMSSNIVKAIESYEKTNSLQSISSLGCLIVVGIQEWEQPDFAGGKAQVFLSIHLGGVGTHPGVVLGNYRSTPSISQGAPAGWVRKTAYIWATRK